MLFFAVHYDDKQAYDIRVRVWLELRCTVRVHSIVLLAVIVSSAVSFCSRTPSLFISYLRVILVKRLRTRMCVRNPLFAIPIRMFACSINTIYWTPTVLLWRDTVRVHWRSSHHMQNLSAESYRQAERSTRRRTARLDAQLVLATAGRMRSLIQIHRYSAHFYYKGWLISKPRNGGVFVHSFILFNF